MEFQYWSYLGPIKIVMLSGFFLCVEVGPDPEFAKGDQVSKFGGN